ncbi:MAG: hypothetical protein ACK4VI_02100 [Alphaproteobacteria bacterium]
MKRPIGSGLFIYDGEWVGPYALLALSTLYWDYHWSKIVLIIMLVLSLFHIMYEHRNAFGKKDVGKRQIYNALAVIVTFLLNQTFVFVIYMAICYATIASRLKKKNDISTLNIKKKTFMRMFLIALFAIAVNTMIEISLLPEIHQGMAQQQQPITGVPGTIRQN